MSLHQIESRSLNETKQVAQRLALLLKPGDVITLEGDLGAGKTAFAQGIAIGLGVKRNVNSPTYTIIKEYEGELPFYHMDVYRLEDSDEDIGFEEYFHGGGISVVEWAHFIEEFLPADRLNIKLTYVDEHTRGLEFFPNGMHFESITAEITG